MNNDAWNTLMNISRSAPQGPFVDDSWERIEMEKAIQLKRAGRYAEAIRIYENVIAKLPQCDPAYKQMAKVQIVAGRFKDAIRSTLMKIDLGIYFTKHCDPQAALQMRRIALENVQHPRFSKAVNIGSRLVASGEIAEMCSVDEVSADVALLAYAEEDVYYYLGHCLVRLFPAEFTNYRIPEELMKNFENAIAGKYSGPDVRDSEYAPIFYVVGYMLARQNIGWTLNTIDPEELKRRYNRVINFLGLAEADMASVKRSFWGRIFG